MTQNLPKRTWTSHFLQRRTTFEGSPSSGRVIIKSWQVCNTDTHTNRYWAVGGDFINRTLQTCSLHLFSLYWYTVVNREKNLLCPLSNTIVNDLNALEMKTPQHSCTSRVVYLLPMYETAVDPRSNTIAMEICMSNLWAVRVHTETQIHTDRVDSCTLIADMGGKNARYWRCKNFLKKCELIRKSWSDIISTSASCWVKECFSNLTSSSQTCQKSLKHDDSLCQMKMIEDILWYLVVSAASAFCYSSSFAILNGVTHSS